MSYYKFDDEQMLGKAVSEVKPFSKLNKKMDIPTEKDIVGDFANMMAYPGLAGKKWSRLCGFTFKTNDGRVFQFVYVPKLRGSLARNQKALSGWYCWSINPSDLNNKQVTSIDDVKKAYGFDITKFVHSDYFDKYLEVFKSNIAYALANQVEELLAKPRSEFEDYAEVVRFVNALKDSLARIGDVKQIVTYDYDDANDDIPEYAKGAAPKIGHAKIAYNADKTYDLRNRTKNVQDAMRKQRALQDIAQKADNN